MTDSMKPEPGTPLPWMDAQRIMDDAPTIIREELPDKQIHVALFRDHKDMLYAVHAANSLPSLSARLEGVEEERDQLKQTLRELHDAIGNAYPDASKLDPKVMAAIYRARPVLL